MLNECRQHNEPKRTNAQTNAQTNEQTNERTNARQSERTKKQTNERTNERTKQSGGDRTKSAQEVTTSRGGGGGPVYEFAATPSPPTLLPAPTNFVRNFVHSFIRSLHSFVHFVYFVRSLRSLRSFASFVRFVRSFVLRFHCTTRAFALHYVVHYRCTTIIPSHPTLQKFSSDGQRRPTAPISAYSLTKAPSSELQTAP